MDKAIIKEVMDDIRLDTHDLDAVCVVSRSLSPFMVLNRLRLKAPRMLQSEI